MKKLLATVLAVVLALGMATVALADNTVVDLSLEYDLYPMDKESKQVSNMNIGYTAIQGGVTLYIPVTTKVDTDDGIKTKNTISTGHMRNYRIKLDGSESQGMITGAQWQVAEGHDYRNQMYVAVTTGVNKTNKDMEVSFKLLVSPKDSVDAAVEGFDDEMEYEYTIFLAPGSGAATQPSTGSGVQPGTGSGATVQQPSTGSGNTGNLVADVTKAIADAKKNGVAAPRSDVNVTNESGISAKDLQELVNAARSAGGNVRILADSTADGALVGRLYIQPASAAAITANLSYGVATSGDGVAATEAMFEKFYNNDVSVVRLAQDGTFGFPVEVAAKVDISALNQQSLLFYSYNRATGLYYAISAPAYKMDNAGFLHFTTTLAGDILITDKALSAK